MGASSPSPDDSGVVAIGSVLDGRYRVDAILGSGGMGRVYKAEHTGIGRAVAIKVLHARLGGSKEAEQRFKREAHASGRLDHPNIVGVSDFGVLGDGSLYLVMEALEGEPLGKRLERDKRIPWPEALSIIRAVLSGLRHAHDKGVVHRDIKPDNIFLARKDGEQVVKILDFGIAKLYAGNADDPATTRAGLTVGTPAYLSPEQAVGGAITPASDLYSTSVVLYEMLTGRAPFVDDDPLAMLRAHVSLDPPTFAEVAPDLELPPGIEVVINRGLAKLSAERIGSSIDYAKELDNAVRAAGYDPLVAVPRSSLAFLSTGPTSIPTPLPGSMFMTPPPTAYGTTHGASTTQLLDAAGQPVATSFIDVSQPLSKKLKIAALAMVACGLVAAVYFMFIHKGGTSGAKTTIVTVPIAVRSEVDRETLYKAAVHDLENGKTCADRKAAIPTLVELGDAKAVPALKKARYRMRGGVIGIGGNNTNACLKMEAERAVHELGGAVK